MSRFDPHQTVGSIVAAAPGTARVFERYGVDFCCGGGMTLSDALRRKGVAPEDVLRELDVATAAAASSRSLVDATAGEVVDHLLATHHAFVKREIPRLSALVDKVERVHGPTHATTIPPLARLWRRASSELLEHLAKEEEVLFPMIRALEASGSVPARFGIDAPIGVMEREHEVAGRDFAKMRTLASGYVPPADACGSWRVLWASLDEFERDLHAHVHLENHVLFPKALARAGLTV
jgi:regulator of cell morphogenesis and NO signaling